MTYTEQAICFPCDGETLVGILSAPETPAQTGVVMIVGGPQYRAGSHRQFVRVSRALANAGYAVLRMDYRGMGDSEGDQRDFLGVDADIKAGIDTLLDHVQTIRGVALWGLCDAASAALLYLHGTHDERVQGLCLLNPWVRSDASLAKTQVRHYYLNRLRQPEFWFKLISGRVAWTAVTGLARNVKMSRTPSTNGGSHSKLSFQDRMAEAWLEFDGPLCLLLSGDDYTAKEFVEYARSSASWASAMAKDTLNRHDEPGADHTLSQHALHAAVDKWSIVAVRKMGASRRMGART